jgi:hypothetical protein
LIAGPLGGVIYDNVGPVAVFFASAGVIAMAALVLVLAQFASVFHIRPETEGAVVE